MTITKIVNKKHKKHGVKAGQKHLVRRKQREERGKHVACNH